MVTARALTWRTNRVRQGVHAPMLLPLLLALLLAPLMAQENPFEGQTIASIQFEPAEGFLHPDDHAEATATIQAGKPLAMTNVRETIERLYATGRFVDIQVHADPAAGGVAVRFVLTPAGFVRNVNVSGVDQPPSRGQLVNASGLQLGEQYSAPQVKQSVERLLESLRTNGFYLAKIEPAVIPLPFQQVDIDFAVTPGKRARYATPIIRGTPQKPVDEIVRSTRWRKWWGFGPFREVTEGRTQRALDRIK